MSKNNNDDKNKIRRRKVTSSNTDVNKNTSKDIKLQALKVLKAIN